MDWLTADCEIKSCLEASEKLSVAATCKTPYIIHNLYPLLSPPYNCIYINSFVRLCKVVDLAAGMDYSYRDVILMKKECRYSWQKIFMKCIWRRWS